MRRDGWARYWQAAALSAVALASLGCARETYPAATYPAAYGYPAYGTPYGYPPGYGPPPPGAYAAPQPGGQAKAGSYGGPPSLSGNGPSAPLQGASAAIAFARAQLGKPYCWGGNGPTCFDCSGLTHAAWLAGGKSIPRTSSAQSEKLSPVPMEALRPGDVVWRPGHVGLYVGDGLAIHSPESGDVVRYQEVGRYKKAFRP